MAAAAISVPKKKSRPPKRVKVGDFIFFLWFFANILVLILIFLWSISTTIISGNMVHVCLSSRKLHLYCISAGTHPSFDLPIPFVNGSSNSSGAEQAGYVASVLALHNSREKAKSEGLETLIDDGNILLENSVLRSTIHVAESPHSPGIMTQLSGARSTNEMIAHRVSLPPGFAMPKARGTPSLSFPFGLKAFTETERKNTTEIVGAETNNAIPALYKSSDKNMDNEMATALMDVEEQLRIHRSWTSSDHRSTNCNGRGVYIYDLPSKFNKDIIAQCNGMVPWADLCNYFSNDALGEPIQTLGSKGWYQTHQYALEPIFHSRVLNHPCRVYNKDEAKLFYVPFYGGLDILRWHFKNVTDDVKDSLSQELVSWLETQETWLKKSGKDHVFVLGKISWDFRRCNGSKWGTRFLEFEQMQNPIKLLIERQPWHVNDIGIPHPTSFHPQTDEDITTWQQKIISSYRRSLVSFAGAARPDSADNIRSILIQQCISLATEDCSFLNCSSGSCDHQPESLIELFVESEFCLQPPGDSPTRKSLFDSLISGCIPVIFDPFTAYYQYPWHLPEDRENYSVFIDKDEVRNMKVNVAEKLAKIPRQRRDDMRRYIVYELLPRLVYGDSNSKLQNFQDAFTITMNNLIQRMNELQ